MSKVDVSMYNCDSSALENLPLDSDFSENFESSQKGGARRQSRQQRRSHWYN